MVAIETKNKNYEQIFKMLAKNEVKLLVLNVHHIYLEIILQINDIIP